MLRIYPRELAFSSISYLLDVLRSLELSSGIIAGPRVWCVDIGSHVISESDEVAPATMGDVFSTLEKLGAITPGTCQSMRKSVGFRNVAVHNYDVINWEIVFAICQNFLAHFRSFASEITGYFK